MLEGLCRKDCRGFTKICNNFFYCVILWLRLKNDMTKKIKRIMSLRNNIEKDDENENIVFYVFF